MSHTKDDPSDKQIDAGPLPERAHLSLYRQWGCIALFLSHFEVVQEGEQAVFYCRSQAQVPHLRPFQHDLSAADFWALWQALQASDPTHWAAEYGQSQEIFSTGALSGTLSLEYTLGGQAFSHTVRFQETEFEGDVRMQQLYADLVEFETRRLDLEAGRQEEIS